MKLSDFNPITKGMDILGGLANKYIEDKDKRNEFLALSEQAIRDSVDSARAHDKASYGNAFVDGFRGLIRPVITTAFAGNYLYRGETFTPYDFGILGICLTFWFGGRELQKFVNKFKN